jgi:hypothetical protein
MDMTALFRLPSVVNVICITVKLKVDPVPVLLYVNRFIVAFRCSRHNMNIESFSAPKLGLLFIEKVISGSVVNQQDLRRFTDETG